MPTHLEKLWCAMFVSEGWYEMWSHYKDNTIHTCEGQLYRKYALKCKAIGIVEYDRMLNKYDEAMKGGNILKEVFVFGDSDVVED